MIYRRTLLLPFETSIYFHINVFDSPYILTVRR